jgi:acetyl-CoA synthetase
VRRITYAQLLEQVCKCANLLKRLGVRKGDAVCIYMPMVPEAAIAMLACARLGAPHSVVFAVSSSGSSCACIAEQHSSIAQQHKLLPFQSLTLRIVLTWPLSSSLPQGFSADALRDRINDGQCRYVITADEGLRGGKHIPLKSTVDLALAQCPDVKACVVYQHTRVPIQMKEGRDLFWEESLALERGYAPCEPMDSEDVLFMLFTSGSTGTDTWTSSHAR